MLRKNPAKRITPEDALKHNFFVRNGFKYHAQHDPKEAKQVSKKLHVISEEPEHENQILRGSPDLTKAGVKPETLFGKTGVYATKGLVLQKVK